jgi:serine/threonine-protein kinase
MHREGDWWSRLEVAFHGAAELPLDDRPAYLDRVCGGDLALRTEVDALLAANTPDRALGIERMVPDADFADPFIGMRLGAWLIVDLIGRGGMGTVYLAERADGQYEQRVALKIVHVQSETFGASWRFQAERHILARVSHPNIARLLDAGLTPEGSAYLVMELVDGSPITTYCDDHRLTVADRLRLFGVVVDATQHAHQSLVVHRDLKPANIFVSRTGEVKLLDFGIAKLLEADRPNAEATARDQRVLTPGYAAPEQIRGDPVTTAADVYVLGVVLYQLLTGHRPVGGDGLTADLSSPESAVAFDPLPPSQAIRRLHAAVDSEARAELAAVLSTRSTTASKLTRSLHGDVDRVVLKALRPEPERRYASAAQFADDINRLLNGRPVSAQNDSLAYRVRRFIGRHRVGVGMAASLFLLSASFAVVAGLQARAVAAERDRARLEAERAGRVSLLAADLFTLAEPAVGRGETITARELLDRATARIGSELQGDAQTAAELFNAIGRIYGSLGLHAQAIAVFERALDLQHRTGQSGTAAEAETLFRLGASYSTMGNFPEAERRLREALALRRRLPTQSPDVAATLEELGRSLSLAGKSGVALPFLEEAVALRRAEPRLHANERMAGLSELGSLLHETGDFKRAEGLFREAVEVGRTIAEPSPQKIAALVQFATVIQDFDREPARAETLYREALGLARSIHPGDHEQVAQCLGDLAENLEDLGRFGEAESAARESVAMWHRLYGELHDEAILHTRILAKALRAQGKFAEAERLMREALHDSRVMFGDGHPTVSATARELAGVLEAAGRFDAALSVRQADLATIVKTFGEHHVYAAIALTGLGRHSLAAGHIAEADRYFRRALDVREHIHPAGHWRVDEAHVNIGIALLRARRFAEAERELLPAYEHLRSSRGATAEETVSARKQLADLYERWQRPADAQRYRGEG